MKEPYFKDAHGECLFFIGSLVSVQLPLRFTLLFDISVPENTGLELSWFQAGTQACYDACVLPASRYVTALLSRVFTPHRYVQVPDFLRLLCGCRLERLIQRMLQSLVQRLLVQRLCVQWLYEPNLASSCDNGLGHGAVLHTPPPPSVDCRRNANVDVAMSSCSRTFAVSPCATALHGCRIPLRKASLLCGEVGSLCHRGYLEGLDTRSRRLAPCVMLPRRTPPPNLGEVFNVHLAPDEAHEHSGGPTRPRSFRVANRTPTSFRNRSVHLLLFAGGSIARQIFHKVRGVDETGEEVAQF